VIEFHCRNCGHPINLPETCAGKQVECPECKKVVVVPAPVDKSDSVPIVRCLACGRELKVPENFKERLIECSECGAYVDLQFKKALAAEKGDAIQLSDVPEDDFQGRIGTLREEAEQQNDEVGRRKLPWLIDIFLYPANFKGIIIIGIFIASRLLGGLDRFFGMFGYVTGIVQFLVGVYIYWYFCECIRDSLEGGLRVPVSITVEITFADMIWRSFNVLACCAFFFGPEIIYKTYTTFTNTPLNNVVLWSLRSIGLFFCPMGILAVIRFDSLRGLNPVLIVRSIASVFFQYCGLVILFFGFIFPFLFDMLGVDPSAAVAMERIELMLRQLFSGFMSLTLINITFIWYLFIIGHLLGRLYWKYQDRLSWEV
jgi:DNA-directed RNA polymerase subunit RPC12/RpoP